MLTFEETNWNLAAGRRGSWFALEHRRERKKVALRGVVIGRIVATRALQLDPQKRGRDNVAFGGEGSVVFGSHREPGAAAFVLTAAHQDQFGYKPVERFAVAQRVVEEKAERAGAALRLIQERRVFGEKIEPLADEVIGAALVVQQQLDRGCAFVRIFVGEKREDLGLGRRNADGVERDAAEEGFVEDQIRRSNFVRRDGPSRPLGAGLDPLA